MVEEDSKKNMLKHYSKTKINIAGLFLAFVIVDALTPLSKLSKEI